ncbi:MAG: hypothetical protein P8L77_03685 [Gammaproteobacteria bacterium]|nr:hypothetical protein [Gammaproteobacteria bacterium]
MTHEMNQHPLLYIINMFVTAVFNICSYLLSLVFTIIFGAYHMLAHFAHELLDIFAVCARCFAFVPLLSMQTVKGSCKYLHQFCSKMKWQSQLINLFWTYTFNLGSYVIYKLASIINRELELFIGHCVRIIIIFGTFMHTLFDLIDVYNKNGKTNPGLVALLFKINFSFLKWCKFSLLTSICESAEDNYLNKTRYLNIIQSRNFYGGNGEVNKETSWVSLCSTTSIDVFARVTMIVLQLTIGPVVGLIGLIRHKLVVLRDELQHIQEKLRQFYQLCCDKKDFDHSAVESWVAVNMFIPWLIYHIFENTIGIVGHVFKSALDIALIPLDIIFTLCLTAGDVADKYWPSLELIKPESQPVRSKTITCYKSELDNLSSIINANDLMAFDPPKKLVKN